MSVSEFAVQEAAAGGLGRVLFPSHPGRVEPGGVNGVRMTDKDEGGMEMTTPRLGRGIEVKASEATSLSFRRQIKRVESITSHGGVN